jgi:hypothetical protein
MRPRRLRDTHLHTSLRQLTLLALAISLGAAVSLGITRFAYGLLLPAMRQDRACCADRGGDLNFFCWHQFGYALAWRQRALVSS